MRLTAYLLCFFSAACTLCLHAQQYGKQAPYGQKGEVFVESCFKNPSAPYCVQRDFVVKPTKDGKGTKYATVNGVQVPVESTVDAAGIDWRFADPAADTVAVLNGAKFAAAPSARTVVEAVGGAADAQKVIQALSGVGQIALSAHEGKIVMMVTGRAPDTILPAMGAGWKATPLGSSALLIGNAEAVDQAAQRLTVGADLSELPAMGLLRPDADFWAAAPAKLADEPATKVGVKWIELSGAVTDKVTGDTLYKFDAAPDAATIGPWLKLQESATVEGNLVRVKGSLDVKSVAGSSLASIFTSARYLPARETAETVHTHPVIYGLDGGPRETR